MNTKEKKKLKYVYIMAISLEFNIILILKLVIQENVGKSNKKIMHAITSLITYLFLFYYIQIKLFAVSNYIGMTWQYKNSHFYLFTLIISYQKSYFWLSTT